MPWIILNYFDFIIWIPCTYWWRLSLWSFCFTLWHRITELFLVRLAQRTALKTLWPQSDFLSDYTEGLLKEQIMNMDFTKWLAWLYPLIGLFVVFSCRQILYPWPSDQLKKINFLIKNPEDFAKWKYVFFFMHLLLPTQTSDQCTAHINF